MNPRTTRPPRTLVLLSVALVAAALLAGVAFVALRSGALPGRVAGAPATNASSEGPTGSGGPTSQPADDLAQGPTASPSRQRAADRAGRARNRPSPSPSLAPPPVRPPATDGGTVVSSGTCGVSYYDEPQPTASGEPFDPEALTAAHKTLPFNTRVRVTNPATGRSVTVRINDRGPYIAGRCLDLSRAAFRAIADLDTGVFQGRYEVLR
ncbi:MAG TPA: septal ring lytic transglycosylase RlpA family protein [Micromonosporaceae bacterium]|nr:septal ring lytic transglycosylase RlpA family protein [Micromonosporaceae bacterium]